MNEKFNILDHPGIISNSDGLEESIVENIGKKIAEEMDRSVFDAFEHYGFSKEWLMNPENNKRVMITQYPFTDTGFIKVFSVDGICLFAFISQVGNSEEEYSFKWTRDIALLSKASKIKDIFKEV